MSFEINRNKVMLLDGGMAYIPGPAAPAGQDAETYGKRTGAR